MNPSPKKVTSRDVAAHLGVSKWTVSRAFREGTSVDPALRERILAVAAEMGYTPNLLARSLSTHTTRLIAVVVDELANPNQLRTLNEATRQLQAKGFSTLLLNLGRDYRPTEALRLADQFQVDGIIFLGTSLQQELIAMTRKFRRIPLVVLLRTSDEEGISYASTDGFAAGQDIARLFTQQGFKRIGYLAGPLSERTELRRLDGFRAGLRQQGLEVAEVLEADRYDRDVALTLLQAYLARTPAAHRLQALFCENDILAIGALDALVAQGLQGQMAVVGFDDIDLAASPSYQLTTVRQPIDALVQAAVAQVLAPSDAPRQPFLTPGTLVLRGTHRWAG